VEGCCKRQQVHNPKQVFEAKKVRKQDLNDYYSNPFAALVERFFFSPSVWFYPWRWGQSKK
jgi:hypothetical protein